MAAILTGLAIAARALWRRAFGGAVRSMFARKGAGFARGAAAAVGTRLIRSKQFTACAPAVLGASIRAAAEVRIPTRTRPQITDSILDLPAIRAAE